MKFKSFLPALIAVFAFLLPLTFGVAALAEVGGPIVYAAVALAILALPTLLGQRVFGAYPNKLIIEGQRDSFMADPDGSAISQWLRCKLVADAAEPSGRPVLQLASNSERGSVVTLQPIAAGAYGACAPLNGSGGEILCVCSGTIASGAAVYAATNGRVAGSGSVLLGVAQCAGADGGTVVYLPNPVAA